MGDSPQIADLGRWDELIDLVRAHLGVTEHGPYVGLLEDRVMRAAKAWDAPDQEHALALLVQEPHRLEELVEAAVIPETHFFREPARLRALLDGGVAAILEARPPGHPLRLWSAGCSSGEEAYTLAIMLHDRGHRSWEVLGTDVSPTAIRRAAEGVYGRWSFRGVPPGIRERHFHEHDGRFRIRSGLPKHTTFTVLNLVPDPYPQDVDVIVCRNVLVYMDLKVQRATARRFARALAPGGWLMTAATDPVLADDLGLERVRTPAGWFYRRADARSMQGLDDPPRRETTPPTRGRPTAPRRTRRPVLPVRRSHRAAVPDPVPDQLLGPPTERIRGLMADGRTHDAEALIRETVAAWPLDPEPRYLLAVLALEAGRPGEAARAAASASYLEPDLAAVHIVLGHAQRGMGNADQAARSWATARTLLRATDPAAPVPLTDGEPAGRLLALLDGVASRAEPTSLQGRS